MWMMHICIDDFDLLKPVKHATVVRYQEFSSDSRYNEAVYKLHNIVHKHSTEGYEAVFVHDEAERRVQWRQAVRTEIFAVFVSDHVQRYAVLARFIAVVGVAHESDGKSIDRRSLQRNEFRRSGCPFLPNGSRHRRTSRYLSRARCTNHDPSLTCTAVFRPRLGHITFCLSSQITYNFIQACSDQFHLISLNPSNISMISPIQPAALLPWIKDTASRERR